MRRVADGRPAYPRLPRLLQRPFHSKTGDHRPEGTVRLHKQSGRRLFDNLNLGPGVHHSLLNPLPINRDEQHAVGVNAPEVGPYQLRYLSFSVIGRHAHLDKDLSGELLQRFPGNPYLVSHITSFKDTS